MSYYEAFAQGLRELGYVDYKDFVLDRRATGTQVGTRLPDVAAELVSLKVDLIVADSTAAALVAKNATRTIPIVAITGDPIGSGLVSNFARPGGNITAVSMLSRELNVERLELLKEAAPEVTRVAVLQDWADSGGASDLEEMRLTARALGVKLIPLETRGPADFWRAFATATKERADGLIVTLSWEPLASLWFGRVLDFARENRLPTIYSHGEVPAVGGLMSYGVSVNDLMQRVAVYVDKILRGAKPAKLPIEQPTKFEFIVNLKTAKTLGLTLPPAVLVRADRVIE